MSSSKEKKPLRYGFGEDGISGDEQSKVSFYYLVISKAWHIFSYRQFASACSTLWTKHEWCAFWISLQILSLQLRHAKWQFPAYVRVYYFFFECCDLCTPSLWVPSVTWDHSFPHSLSLSLSLSFSLYLFPSLYPFLCLLSRSAVISHSQTLPTYSSNIPLSWASPERFF